VLVDSENPYFQATVTLWGRQYEVVGPRKLIPNEERDRELELARKQGEFSYTIVAKVPEEPGFAVITESGKISIALKKE
jgi:hypothetical protein